MLVCTIKAANFERVHNMPQANLGVKKNMNVFKLSGNPMDLHGLVA